MITCSYKSRNLVIRVLFVKRKKGVASNVAGRAGAEGGKCVSGVDSLCNIRTYRKTLVTMIEVVEISKDRISSESHIVLKLMHYISLMEHDRRM
jgi:hypothetical protein